MNPFPTDAEVIPILSVTEGTPAPLFFFTTSEGFEPPSHPKFLYFTTEKTLVYTAFFADFGPLDLGLTYKFCKQMEDMMALAVKENKSVGYYCSNRKDGHARANSAVLLCAYLILVLGMQPEKAYKPFFQIKKPFTPFRDAAFALNSWPLFVVDCAKAFHKAASNGHFDYSTFDLEKFEFMAQLHNGDMSWIIPNKLLAFSGPLAKRKELASGKHTLTPEDYCAPFKELGVRCIVRFNSKCYDKRIFERSGFNHVDMFYEDGANPTDAILQQFLSLVETQSGGIAVHCKAGLGRTGTNICAYMIKHLGYSARESIAWHRICRPGAVVGPQQQYLCSMEDKLVMEGAQFKALRTQDKLRSDRSRQTSPIPSTVRRGSKDRRGSKELIQALERKDSASSATRKLANLKI